MIFKKQSLALLLSCVASAHAFSSVGFVGRSSAVVAPDTTHAATFLSKNSRNSASIALFESAEVEPAAESESAPVVDEVAPVIDEVASVVDEVAPVVDEVAPAVDEVAPAVEEAAPAVEEKPAKPAIQRPEEDITCVAYVVNLSYDTTFFKIKEIFQQHGTVTKVFVPKDKETKRPKGIAFVTMGSEAERDAAIAALNEADIDGRTVYVDKAKPRGEFQKPDVDMTKLYVGNISYETTAENLISVFGEYGPVENVYVPTDRETGAPRGFAFLAMKPADAEKAIETLDGTELSGRYIEVKVSLPRGQKAAPRVRTDETKVYIGNISFDTEEGTLRELFGNYGPIIDLYVPTDQNTGRPRGFAFVTLEPKLALQAIEECDGYELDGRMLRVNEAQAKGSNRGGGYAGGDGYDNDTQNDQPVNDW